MCVGGGAIHLLDGSHLRGEDDLGEGLGGCNGLVGLAVGSLHLVFLGEVKIRPVGVGTPLWGGVVGVLGVTFLHVLEGALGGGGGGGGGGVGVGGREGEALGEGGALGEEEELLVFVIIFVSSLRSAEGGKGRDEGAEISGLGLGGGLGGRSWRPEWREGRRPRCCPCWPGFSSLWSRSGVEVEG